MERIDRSRQLIIRVFTVNYDTRLFVTLEEQNKDKITPTRKTSITKQSS